MKREVYFVTSAWKSMIGVAKRSLIITGQSKQCFTIFIQIFVFFLLPCTTTWPFIMTNGFCQCDKTIYG